MPNKLDVYSNHDLHNWQALLWPMHRSSRANDAMRYVRLRNVDLSNRPKLHTNDDEHSWSSMGWTMHQHRTVPNSDSNTWRDSLHDERQQSMRFRQYLYTDNGQYVWTAMGRPVHCYSNTNLPDALFDG
jgi:hypothetical protein